MKDNEGDSIKAIIDGIKQFLIDNPIEAVEDIVKAAK